MIRIVPDLAVDIDDLAEEYLDNLSRATNLYDVLPEEYPSDGTYLESDNFWAYDLDQAW